jgi:hypothetical protein
MALVFSEAEDVRKLNTATYVWRDCPSSITRANNASYMYETIPDFVKSTGYIFEEIKKRHAEQLQTYVCQSIVNVYFMLHKKDWRLPEKAALLKAAEAAYGKMITPYAGLYKSMPDNAFAAMYNAERAVSFNNEIETERLDRWLERIMQ